MLPAVASGPSPTTRSSITRSAGAGPLGGSTSGRGSSAPGLPPGHRPGSPAGAALPGGSPRVVAGALPAGLWPIQHRPASRPPTDDRHSPHTTHLAPVGSSVGWSGDRPGPAALDRARDDGPAGGARGPRPLGSRGRLPRHGPVRRRRRSGPTDGRARLVGDRGRAGGVLA